MYKIHKAQFMLCAAWKSQWPENDLPEICLAGRSNVGKSSFINTITNHSKLANPIETIVNLANQLASRKKKR